MLKLSELDIVESREALKAIPEGKVLINTINAHSFNVAQEDEVFAESLTPTPSLKGEGNQECVKYLIPDGASIVKACKWLKGKSMPKERIAGWDLFAFEMQRLERKSEEAPQPPKGEGCRGGNGKCEKSELSDRKLRVMFMGSSEKGLERIRERARVDYPHLEVVTYSPPYKPEFSEEDDAAIIKAINEANPDLLWIGMTAPKQEKWTYQHWKALDIHCHVGTIGAVFDFYAGTAERAPRWWQEHGLEWLYRLCIEPKRMWRRYVIGNPLFLWNIKKEMK